MIATSETLNTVNRAGVRKVAAFKISKQKCP